MPMTWQIDKNFDVQKPEFRRGRDLQEKREKGKYILDGKNRSARQFSRSVFFQEWEWEREGEGEGEGEVEGKGKG